VVTTAATGTLAACGLPGGGQGGDAAVQVGSLRGVAVEYWSVYAPTHPTSIATSRLFDDFNARNEQGITVNAKADAGTGGLEKVTAAAAAGTPPDLTNTQNFNLSGLFANGTLVDIDEALKGSAEWRRVRPTIYPNVVRGLSWKGKLFAVPSHNGGQLLYHNPVALRRVGLSAPARTWTRDQFIDQCRRAAQPPEVWGYISGWQYSDLGNLALNDGGRLIKDDLTAYTLTSPEVTETVEWLLSLVRAGVMPPHDGSRTGGYRDLIPEGKTVFQPAVSLRISDWRRRGGFEFGTAYNPLGARNRDRQNFSHGAAHGFGVFKQSDARRTQGALAAAVWTSRLEAGKILAEDGGLQVVYKTILEAPEFQTRWKSDADLWPFFEIMPNVLPFANGPKSQEERTIIDEQLRAIWKGDMSVRDGLGEAQRQAQRLLDESLRG
jgi:ABC-type glycerol-3-phosphate transport system substrate-binding protein